MKLRTIFLMTTLCFCAINKIIAYDFAAVNHTGDTIYYNITSTTTVEVTNNDFYRGNIVIPDNVTHEATTYTVSAIGNDAFYDCSELTSVSIPNTVTTIGNYAFYYCNGLTAVNIPDTITTIGNWAFYHCSGLTSISFPNTITTIETYAFAYCSGLTALTVPHSVTFIGNSAFRDCSNLTSISLSNALTTIEDEVFANCYRLSSITIPHSVTSIGDWAFYYCSGLTSVIIPNLVTVIGISAFNGCSGLTSITIPYSVTVIGNDAFMDCNGLTSVDIPNSVMSIGDYAFYNCSGLTSITIGNSVVIIGNYAFNNTKLTEIHVKANTPPVIYENTFHQVPDTIPVYVPCRTSKLYDGTLYWKKFENFKDSASFQIIVQSNNSLLGRAFVVQTSCQNNDIIIVAIAGQNCHFLQWNDGNTDNPRTIMIMSDTTFIAEFDVITNIEKINIPSVTIYPNPTTNNITVILPENVPSALFTIYDLQGKMIIRKNIRSQDVISTENLADGIYIYHVTTGKEYYQGKIIRE
jgi:hypothetical protein